MKVGDLVRTKSGSKIGVVIGNKIGVTNINAKRTKWFRIFFAGCVGQEFGPVDGISIMSRRHLEVISESR